MPELKDAVDAIKLGNKDKGRRILMEVIKENPHNEAAWLWMSRTTDDLQQKRDCFQRALQINPDSEAAKKALAKLNTIAPDIKTKEASKDWFSLTPLFIAFGVAIGCVILAFVPAAIAYIRNPAEFSKPRPTATVRPTRAPAGLPGLNPADVTESLKKTGFDCTQVQFGTGYYYWTCKDDNPGYSISVNVYGSTLQSVDYISAVLFDYGGAGQIKTQFFRFISTVPYANNSPESAMQWIEANIDKSQANATFGGVPFELYGDDNDRTLTIGRFKW